MNAHTTRRAAVALATAAAAFLTSTVLAPAASASPVQPCQYDASTPGTLVVLAGARDDAGDRVTVLHHHHRTHAHLDATGRLIRSVPLTWTDLNTRVYVSGHRCETT